jgi:hypothetical protein
MKPDIYFFNPTCELAVANGSANFMAPMQLRQFEDELSTLPWILARPEDIVLVDQLPPQQFTNQLESAGFRLPTFIRIEFGLTDPTFLGEEKGFLYPWGWSPAAHKLLSPLKSGCCSEFLNSPVADWRNVHRELYSRRSALKILKKILENDISNNLLSINDLPEICTSHEQIIALQQKWGKVVVKSPLSSSGRGLQILRPNEYNQTNRQVITGFLRQQDYVVVEPWHNKVLDLSFQFFSLGNGTIEYQGLTSFSTNQAGHYIGNFIQELPPDLTSEIKAFLQENIPQIKKILQGSLIESNYSTEHYGWLGVDAIIFRDKDDKLKFLTCLEINCRFTMGAIALNLRNHLAEHSIGEFRIMHGTEGQFAQFCEERMANEPLIIEGGKIVSGFLPVTTTSSESSFGAYISAKREKN